MEDHISPTKEHRRRILSTLSNWNVGVRPDGKLATESCFVHNSVPDIVINKVERPTIEHKFVWTASEQTANLILSGISDASDTETLKSISICDSIFHPTSQDLQEDVSTIHFIQYSVNATIVLENIARLTKEFENELTKAEEHWPHRPKESWDKLCQIWNRYGFLWPQQVQIGYTTHETHQKYATETFESVKLLLKNKSQGAQQRPKSLSVIYRKKLRPMHDFFPAEYTTKKEFIMNIILKFSTLVLNDSLFRLKNVKSGDYFGWQNNISTSSSRITVIPSSCANLGNRYSSNISWAFNNSLLKPKDKYMDQYVFNGDKKYIRSSQDDNINTYVICKSYPEQPTFLLNDNRSRVDVNLVSFKASEITHVIDYNCEWDIEMPSQKASSIMINGVLHMDQLLKKRLCLTHGDRIILKQAPFYLTSTTAANSHDYTSSLIIRSTDNVSLLKNQVAFKKSPFSIASSDMNQFNFSSGDLSSSNSTQPTIACDSNISPTTSLNQSKATRELNETPQYKTHSAYMELLPPENQAHVPSEFCWKVELLSKSIAPDQVKSEKQKVEFVNTINSVLAQNNAPDNNVTKFNNITAYNPKLNISIMQSRSPELDLSKTDEIIHVAQKKDSSVAVPSSISNESQVKITSLVLEQKKPQFTEVQQRSTWLTVNPKLYNWNQNIMTSEQTDGYATETASPYYTPTDSVPQSATSLLENKLLLNISSKKRGKMPANKINKIANANSDDSSGWSLSQSSPAQIDKNNNADLEVSTASTPALQLTEAEAFKRGVQQTFKEQQINQENMKKSVLKSIFAPSFKSSTTSQIRHTPNIDDDDISGSSSSEVQTYTMTPNSRRRGLPTTPTSLANLTPEERVERRRIRESSFISLLGQETRGQLLCNAIKRSTLVYLVRKIADNKNQPPAQDDIFKISCTRFRHNSKRVIQKKKGFYHKQHSRRQFGVVV